MSPVDQAIMFQLPSPPLPTLTLPSLSCLTNHRLYEYTKVSEEKTSRLPLQDGKKQKGFHFLFSASLLLSLLLPLTFILLQRYSLAQRLLSYDTFFKYTFFFKKINGEFFFCTGGVFFSVHENVFTRRPGGGWGGGACA
ncbi:hypothetical protein QOT17_012452 [Balamuthia mandrillaris]